MAVPSFAPANSVLLSAGPTSTNATIPSGGTILAVTNVGEVLAYGSIGTASTLAATWNTGFAILPGETEYLTIGSNTTIAAVTSFRMTGLNLTSGN